MSQRRSVPRVTSETIKLIELLEGNGYEIDKMGVSREALRIGNTDLGEAEFFELSIWVNPTWRAIHGGQL